MVSAASTCRGAWPHIILGHIWDNFSFEHIIRSNLSDGASFRVASAHPGATRAWASTERPDRELPQPDKQPRIALEAGRWRGPDTVQHPRATLPHEAGAQQLVQPGPTPAQGDALS